MSQSMHQANVVELLPAASRNTSANGTGVDARVYNGVAHFVLASSAGAGTTPTLNVKLQESDAVASGYTDIPGATFTEVTDAADLTEMISLQIGEVKRYVRAVATIGGATPSFEFSVVALATRAEGRNTTQSV